MPNGEKPGTPGNELVKTSPETRVVMQAEFGKFYTTVRGGQIMAPVRAEMTLFERLGQIYEMKGKWVIQGPGYRHLNKVSSISLLSPTSVVVDGKLVPNPHIERDPKTKAVTSVNLRKVGIGYSLTGNLVVIDKTLFFHPYTYFIQAVQAKMKKGAKGAKYGIEATKPTDPGAWVFFEMQGTLGIWMDYTAAEIIDCLEELTQRQKFAERMASTIVERNILKDHPAIGTTQVRPIQDTERGVKANVTVYGWRVADRPEDFGRILAAVEKNIEASDLEGVVVQKETITDIEPEIEQEAMAEIEEQDKMAGRLFQTEEKK